MHRLPIEELGRWAADIGDVGYAVVAGAFTSDEVVILRRALERVFAQERAVAAERGWANDTYRVAYMLPAKDRRFLEVAWHPNLLALARAVLGNDCVLAALNGLTPTPGGRAQRLHRDEPPWVPTQTLQLQLVCVLDPFTEERGATRVVPRSHRWPGTPTADVLDRSAESIVAEVGSVIGYDAALWHGSGENRTPWPRCALHVYFSRPWVTPHWDFPASLPPDVAASLTEDQRRVLGFANRPRRHDPADGRIDP